MGVEFLLCLSQGLVVVQYTPGTVLCSGGGGGGRRPFIPVDQPEGVKDI